MATEPGQPSTSWPSSSGSTGRQCPNSWREKAYLAPDVPYRRSSKLLSCTPLGCRWSVLASSSGATVAPCTMPWEGPVYGCGPVTPHLGLGTYKDLDCQPGSPRQLFLLQPGRRILPELCLLFVRALKGTS